MSDHLAVHIAIITGAHLCRNPRVVKEALALDRAGYEVSIILPTLDKNLKAEDDRIVRESGVRRHYSVDLSAGGMGATWSRGRRRLAEEAKARLRVEVADSLGYSIRHALKIARELKADYYIGHQEVGAWVAWKLMREGRRVGADLEDWYSRDLLPEARSKRPVRLLDRIERDLVRDAAHCTTTSVAMASAMEEAYGQRPDVIYNAFPYQERDQIDGLHLDRADLETPSLFWFSQTIGPGRGLEELIAGIHLVDIPCQLHLRGNVDAAYQRHLRASFTKKAGYSIHFHDLVPPRELPGRISEHDVGLALEPAHPPNKNLTVSNKIFHFLQAGLGVVVTPTAGQKEVAAAAPSVIPIADHTPEALAVAINELTGSPERLQRAKRLALEAAESTFSWEVQEPLLLELIVSALNRPVTT